MASNLGVTRKLFCNHNYYQCSFPSLYIALDIAVNLKVICRKWSIFRKNYQ